MVFIKRHTPWNKNKKLKKDHIEKLKGPRLQTRGENHRLWKGNNASIASIHSWVKRCLGYPKECEFCGKISTRSCDWANKDHKYKRDLNDWLRLCRSCHKKYDFEHNGVKVWNKGLKGYNKGHRFKKGNIPWNKGKKGVQIAWNKGKPWSKETKKKISKSMSDIINHGRKRSEHKIYKDNLSQHSMD